MLILMGLGDRGSLGQDQCCRRNREGARHGRWLRSEARRASALEELSEVIRGVWGGSSHSARGP